MLKLESTYSNLNVSVLIVLGVLFSCRPSSKIEKRLITDDKDTNMHFGHWQLENGGRAHFFMSAVDNEPSAEITGIEGEIKYTWRFDENDSTLHLGSGAPFKIKKLNKDTIFMTLSTQRKFLLIRRYYRLNP